MRGYRKAGKRRLSRSGVEFIGAHEGFLGAAYLDTIALPHVWTIGFGHTGPDVHEGDTVTRSAGLRLLRKDARFAADAVRLTFADVAVTQHMFDAMVSAVFNLGPGDILNPADSHFARAMLARDYKSAADHLLDWDKAGAGVVVPGLLNRRTDERALFLKPPKRIQR